MPSSPDSSGSSRRLSEIYDRLLSEGGYENREPQRHMAHAVLGAFRSGRHLIAEIPTGVGKSLGYLLPIGLRLVDGAEGRIVISTYSKALQVQLMQKEIPLLSRLLGIQIPHALCLGSQNYLCLRRLDQLTRFGLFDQGELPNVRGLIEWASGTTTGLRTEFQADSGLWDRVVRHPEFCGGRKCRFHGPCFFFAARHRAEHSRLLITNHSLFFANMASGDRVLPEFDAAVMDEAHQLEETAASYFGAEVRSAQFHALADALLLPSGKAGFLGHLSRTGGQTRNWAELLGALRRSARDWHRHLLTLYPASGKPVRVREEPDALEDVPAHLETISEGLAAITAETEDEEVELSGLIARARHLAVTTRSLLSRDLDRHVYWLDNRESGFTLGATPLDISHIMGTGLFSRYQPVILTSGTLTAEQSFSFVRQRLGLQEADELVLESPYDYRTRVMLYVPGQMPDPASGTYAESVASQLVAMRNRVAGGFLVLFTSYRLLYDVASRLEAGNLPLMVQGQAPPHVLLEEFTATENPMLLGTSTFWQGIDLARGNLRAVIITRLPFLVPDNPVVAARIEEVRASGADAFETYQVPAAVLMFRQGFGRLIRDSSGFGVVTVLDPRILSRPYGRRFLKSLPDCVLTRRLEDVDGFLAGHRQPDSHDTPLSP